MNHKISIEDFKEFTTENRIASGCGRNDTHKTLDIRVDPIKKRIKFIVKIKTNYKHATIITPDLADAIAEYNSI